MDRDFITVPVKQDEDPSPAASEPHWIVLAPSEPQYVYIDGVSTLPTQFTDSTEMESPLEWHGGPFIPKAASSAPQCLPVSHS